MMGLFSTKGTSRVICCPSASVMVPFSINPRSRFQLLSLYTSSIYHFDLAGCSFNLISLSSSAKASLAGNMTDGGPMT